jgi:urea carboxylase
MFNTVLIANRGEIACRIIRTAHRLGLKAVAVFSEADRSAPHVSMADRAWYLGPGPARESYLDIDKILEAARATGAGAIHPGYGFLSENADFAQRVEAAGMAFVGPTADQLESFGAKDSARALAGKAHVPLLPGTELLSSAEEAVAQAERIGLPVIVKAVGGGGGIGMHACFHLHEVREHFEKVSRLAAENFASSGVYLERYVTHGRHVEVQVFGDGRGRVAVLGDRDCSLQRRNQKVMEEAPAPRLPDHVRNEMHATARSLARSVRYRSAGTVEFIYDSSRGQAYFLEVNTRLQVEHPVTEEVYGVDLVEAMLRLAQGERDFGFDPAWFDTSPVAHGHAVEARIYAEDPNKNGAPCPGLVTRCVLPGQGASAMEGVRVDGWIRTGLEISPFYDPMLAKVIAHGSTRDEAFDLLGQALGISRIDGVVTNLGLLGEQCANPVVRRAEHSTSTLAVTHDPTPRIDVIEPGLLTTIQDAPGRLGYWQVGVPPSGAMDAISLAEANLAVGNPPGLPALECTATGPTLRFSDDATVAITGAPVPCLLDGRDMPQWEPIPLRAGQTLKIGEIGDVGMRAYLAVRGGFDVPEYLGSAATFTLGGFGGHGGRALAAGDVLRVGFEGAQLSPESRMMPTPEARRPRMTHHWHIAVTEGPHEAPEFFTYADMDEFYSTDWKVHYNSSRTGVRLVGPHPHWARPDGGEAGLHPSNIHDVPYAVGALDFTGDTPIILGPDGPSLGGFVCPAVVACGDMWKVGQLRPNDTVRFVRVREREATSLAAHCAEESPLCDRGDADHGVLATIAAQGDRPKVTYRRDGESNILIEYGEPVLDIGLRMRVHALMCELERREIPGVIDLTPGIRSLQIHMDPNVVLPTDFATILEAIEAGIPDTSHLSVPSRAVRLPLSWDDSQTRLAIERYMKIVRDDAPWCPWNIEFIRRINGLDSVDEVYGTVFDATYLVLGLGDVYLGAPVATPLDPRHRLVTTKYNPARTWTPENAVGIGGAYLCVYGMEGPGGYQFVGRTVQMWNRYERTAMFAEGPWALRFFDRISWYPVSHDELTQLRAETAAGRGAFDVREGTFSMADYQRFLDEHHDSIAAFKRRQTTAFEQEEQRWRASGEFDARPEPDTPPARSGGVALPENARGVRSPMVATVWRIDVTEGDEVRKGDPLISLEAMKMETEIKAPAAGTVVGVYVDNAEQVSQGQTLVAIGGAR